jgi:TetR/AcrR family transcriptional regulator, transcriptional repressor for nem operon
MRRTKQAKRETHVRIVEAAARRFRADGIDGVGIADLMGEAGLTHGGFYAHFDTKDALVAEVCADGLTQASTRLARAARKAPPARQLAKLIDLYLSPYHRDHPEAGCMMPTLSGEIARSAPAVRAAFTQAYKNYRDEVMTFLPDTPDTPDTSDGRDARGGNGDHRSREMSQSDKAMVLLAGLVGTMMLARAVDDTELSERMLQVNRDFYQCAFPGQPSPEEFATGC